MTLTPNTSSLFEWLTVHDTSLEELGKMDKRLFTLIDEYVRLMDAIEYWGDEPKAEDEAFSRLLKNKEREIMNIISGETQ